MGKTILVAFSNVKLKTAKEIRATKLYSFNTDSAVKVGDVITSSSYGTKIQVVKVLDTAFKYYNGTTGELSDTFTSTNQREIAILELRDNEADVVYGSIIPEEKP